MITAKEIATAQSNQVFLRDQIYRLMMDSASKEDLDWANHLYNLSVNLLIEVLGPDASVAEIDCDLAGFYSDLYKDEHSFRPSLNITYAEAKAYVDRRLSANSEECE